MKATKFAIAALVASLVLATGVNATSIGRSGGSSGHSSSSSHSSSSVSHSAPSRPAPSPSVAPAPSKPGGIGGTQSSVGVRKSEVTAPVATSVNAGKPGNFTPGSPAPTSTGAGAPAAPVYSTTPSYGAPVPQPGIGAGGVFMSSLGGSLAGTMLGNALFGNYGHSGTTVINNGAAGVPNPGVVAQGPATVDSSGQVMQSAPVMVQPQKESYSMGKFILDVILFAILVAILVGIVWLFYVSFKAIRNYINKERGVSNQPFNPTQKFWEIQKAFAAGDVASLNNLLGPDVVDELTRDLQPSTLSLSGVSHEVRLNNNTEFSIWYKFSDAGQEVNQVWHYERFGKEWKLNGIENV